MNKQDYNDSDELLKLLASMTARTVTGFMRWKIRDYEPVTWIDPCESFIAAAERDERGFAQNVTFTCSFEHYDVSLELYEELTALGTRGCCLYSLFFLLPNGRQLRRIDFQLSSNACLHLDNENRKAALQSVHRLTDAIFTVMDEELTGLPAGTEQTFDSLIPISLYASDPAVLSFIAQMKDVYLKRQFLNFHLMVWETIYPSPQ